MLWPLWTSIQYTSYVHIFFSHIALLKLEVKSSSESKFVRETVFNDNFTEQCKSLAKLMTLIVKGLYLLVSNCGTISAVKPLYVKFNLSLT
jgi:hypothetical protein